MGKRYLIDTNIAIYLLNGSLPENVAYSISQIIDSEYFISVISKMELLGFDFADATANAIAEEFVEESKLLLLTNEIIEQTITLRKTKRMKLPDAIIAATALVHDLVLVSRNDKDFSGIPDLDYSNPFNS
jgi:toxin FitB